MALIAAVLAGAALVAAACFAASRRLAREAAVRRRDETLCRLLALFGDAAGQIVEDPRRLVTWHPLVRAARRIFPDAFRELDRASGGKFPFGRELVQAAHARWTADWLTWERTHDQESRLRSAAAEEELERRGESGSPLGRARLAALEQERLQQYQERYEEYKRISKAIAAIDQDGGDLPEPDRQR